MENNKTLTAKEFIKKFENKYAHNDGLSEIMIDFAKYHIQKALENAAENAKHIHKEYDKDFKIDKDSILNSYNLENIK